MDEETKEPVTRTTFFQAGSISKPVAAYVALKMIEEGKIDFFAWGRCYHCTTLIELVC